MIWRSSWSGKSGLRPLRGASYVIVSPDAGAVRSTNITVAPVQSTTYTLYATNAFGRTTATVSVIVH
jgi:hypothetical protein